MALPSTYRGTPAGISRNYTNLSKIEDISNMSYLHTPYLFVTYGSTIALEQRIQDSYLSVLRLQATYLYGSYTVRLPYSPWYSSECEFTIASTGAAFPYSRNATENSTVVNQYQ